MVDRLVDAEGLLSRPLWKAAQLIAGCAAWQRASATVTAAAAMERIYWPEADDRADPDDATQPRDHRPRIIVEPGGRYSSSSSSQGTWKGRGEFYMTVQLPVSDRRGLWPEGLLPEGLHPEDLWPTGEVSRPDQLRAATNAIGAILADMQQRSGLDPAAGDVVDPENETLLNVIELQEVFSPMIADPGEHRQDYFVEAVYSWSWF